MNYIPIGEWLKEAVYVAFETNGEIPDQKKKTIASQFDSFGLAINSNFIKWLLYNCSIGE